METADLRVLTWYIGDISLSKVRCTYLPTYHSVPQPWVSLGLLYNQSPQPMRASVEMHPRMLTRGWLLGF
jgi:hypothetical protein